MLHKLPEKISVADPFDEEFLEKRRDGFDEFLKSTCENEELKLSKVLMQFLCDDQLEKEPWYSKVNATSALDGIGSMFSGLGNEEDESVPKSNTPAGTPNPADAKTNTNTNTNSDGSSSFEQPTTSSGNKEDPDFAALSSYIKKLEKELKVSVDISEQVILSFYSLAMLSEAMGENASFLGDCETKGAQMLLKSNQAGGLGKAFKKTGEAMKAMKDPMERRSRDLSKKFRQPLVWAKRLSESCKESTDARAKCLYDVIQAKKRLENAKKKLENQLGGGSIVVNGPPSNGTHSAPDATPTKGANGAAGGATDSPTSTMGTPNNATEQLTSWFSSVTASLTAKPPTIYEMQQDVELKTQEARATEAKYEIVKRRTMVELPKAHARIEKVLNSCFEDMTLLMQELSKVQVAEFESIMPGSTDAQRDK